MSLMQRGFTRLFADGQIIELSSPDDYKRSDFNNVFVLVDRLTRAPDVRQRLVDSLEICFQEDTASPSSKPPKRSQHNSAFPSASNAATTARSTRRPNRVSSASTIRTAPARRARVSATPSASISTS
jgi:excinuclease UvrABC ATPase subunit